MGITPRHEPKHRDGRAPASEPSTGPGRGGGGPTCGFGRRGREPAPEPESWLRPGHPLTWRTLDDPFLALDPDQLAYLTDEQRLEVRAIHADGDPQGEAVLDACLAWGAWARANLEPPYR